MSAFGEFVVGPPGSGKTTYCLGMREFLGALGRPVAIVNLDPANESALADVDIRELIVVDDVMERLDLGPNGALLYCMEFLEQHLDWLRERLEQRSERFFLFDCPGQVELYTHHESVRNILLAITQDWQFRMCTVLLVDSHYCNDLGKFISVLLTSLSTMLNLEMPHVNILSKIDLVESFGRLRFNLDFYTEVLDLSYLLDALDDDPASARYRKLNAAIIELIEDFSLVHFHTLDVRDKASMAAVMGAVDKAVGFIIPSKDEGPNLLTTAFGATPEHLRDSYLAQEKYMADDEV